MKDTIKIIQHIHSLVTSGLRGNNPCPVLTQLCMQLWLQWQETILKTTFSSQERKHLKSGREQCDATMKKKIIGTMKDTIKIIQHIQTYIDMGERRNGWERHCETIPAQPKSKLNQKNSNSTSP